MPNREPEVNYIHEYHGFTIAIRKTRKSYRYSISGNKFVGKITPYAAFATYDEALQDAKDFADSYLKS